MNLGDRFGEVMLSNLHGRGCDLQGAEVCINLEAQKNRYISHYSIFSPTQSGTKRRTIVVTRVWTCAVCRTSVMIARIKTPCFFVTVKDREKIHFICEKNIRRVKPHLMI